MPYWASRPSLPIRVLDSQKLQVDSCQPKFDHQTKYTPRKSFTTLSPATITRLQAICQTPTLTEPEAKYWRKSKIDRTYAYQPAQMAETTTKLRVLTNPLEGRKRVAFYTTLWQRIVGLSSEPIGVYWISGKSHFWMRQFRRLQACQHKIFVFKDRQKKRNHEFI